jgi:uncharacterized membrane protein SirB2
MDYATLRAVHVGCVGVSIGLFTLRAALQFAGVDWRRWRWLRVVPHLNDTLLLAAAVTLAVMSAQYPFVQPWLTAKLLALFAYVALGSLALQREATARRRAVAFAAALASVGYIVAVALTRSAGLGLL